MWYERTQKFICRLLAWRKSGIPVAYGSISIWFWKLCNRCCDSHEKKNLYSKCLKRGLWVSTKFESSGNTADINVGVLLYHMNWFQSYLSLFVVNGAIAEWGCLCWTLYWFALNTTGKSKVTNQTFSTNAGDVVSCCFLYPESLEFYVSCQLCQRKHLSMISLKEVIIDEAGLIKSILVNKSVLAPMCFDSKNWARFWASFH